MLDSSNDGSTGTGQRSYRQLPNTESKQDVLEDYKKSKSIESPKNNIKQQMNIVEGNSTSDYEHHEKQLN